MILVQSHHYIAQQIKNRETPIHRLSIKITELPCAVSAIRYDDAGDNFED